LQNLSDRPYAEKFPCDWREIYLKTFKFAAYLSDLTELHAYVSIRQTGYSNTDKMSSGNFAPKEL
jgi:hypothetical protein